ncbi:hypothetical protein GCM10010302_42580 [Streptomyces polychromogenes]|uniref:Uncharacterized protein n=1 Tax=Streptomyces polychromogenes TaxID=67342 RepID=A0ABN0VGJ1_9ACTN
MEDALLGRPLLSGAHSVEWTPSPGKMPIPSHPPRFPLTSGPGLAEGCVPVPTRGKHYRPVEHFLQRGEAMDAAALAAWVTSVITGIATGVGSGLGTAAADRISRVARERLGPPQECHPGRPDQSTSMSTSAAT